ncbi:MAG: L-fuconolactonase [Glaciecola sp.]|jgi:L-fuconolactonase
MNIQTTQTLMRIDSHHHFWNRKLGYYNWLTEDMGAITSDFSLEGLRSRQKKLSIDKTVLIQAAPDISETKYMLSIAASIDFIVGVVGWVDMQDAEAPYHLARLSKNPYFKGIRPMIQDIQDDDWMLNPALDAAFLSLIQLGLCFDALVKPRHLNQLLKLVNRYPDLNIVIDHAAKPDVVGREFVQWVKDIKALAEKPNVYCKLSGLVTEAGFNPNYEGLVPYMRQLMNVFSASRLMWGSDWPVLNLATDYAQWVDVTEAFLSNTSQIEQMQIWSQTATEFYSLQHLD